MISWVLLILWNMNIFMNVRCQFYICPYEEGLFFSTSPDCRTYYQCLNHILWTGVCFPWQQFDIHTLRCRRLREVDCNPEYAGIWRPVFGEIGEIGNEIGLEGEGETAEEEIIQEEEEEELEGNRPLREDEETTHIEEDEESEMASDEVADAEDEELGADESEANRPLREDEETTDIEEVAENEMDSKEVADAEDDELGADESDENRLLRGDEETTDIEEDAENDVASKEVADAEAEELGADEEKLSSENENETQPGKEVLVENPESKLEHNYDNNEETVMNKNVNDYIFGKEEESNAESIQMAKTRNRRASGGYAKIKRTIQDSVVQDNNWLAKKAEKEEPNRTPTDLGSGNVIHDLMELLSANSNEWKSSRDDAITKQSSTAGTDQLDLAETKQETSSESYWYWCGSGRFVLAQSQKDGDKICLQLQDPEFINEEGGGAGDGHTFLGSNINT